MKSVADEPRRYLKEPTFQLDCDPLLHWSNNRNNYPKLIPLTIKYLAPIGTSVLSESFF